MKYERRIDINKMLLYSKNINHGLTGSGNTGRRIIG